MQCEMCSATGPLQKAVIEGVEMTVCSKCIKLGTPVKAPVVRKNSIKYVDHVVHNAGILIKTEREKRGMRQIDLAKMLQIKDSYIHNIESGHLKLELSLAKKIQSALGIELIKKLKEE